MKRLLIISIWFEVVWFCAVIGNYSLQTVTIALVAATLLFSAFKLPLNWFKCAIVFAVGLAIDYGNFALGIFEFQSDRFPVWLVALWAIFVWYTYFLYPLVSQYPLALVSVVGGIAGTLSYVAGESLGAVSFGTSVIMTTGILLIEWTLIIALIMKVYGYEVRNSNSHLPSADR